MKAVQKYNDKIQNMISPVQAECFSRVDQDFLICTTVHKARQLGVFMGDTYVRTSVGKTHKSSKPFSNSENPYYNEYFVFELKCPLNDLLHMTILYEVRKRTSCKKDVVIGELGIDLQSVWAQPNRCFFKKWGRLENPVGSTGHGSGFLQIDLAIVSQATNIEALHGGATGAYGTQNSMGGTSGAGGSAAAASGIAGGDTTASTGHTEVMSQWQMATDYDDINKNMLQNMDSLVQCNIRYTIIFYKGYFVKRGDYLIQFRFHPYKGRTTVCKATQQPVWNQEIIFGWNYPSVAQTLLIQLHIHEHLTWKSIAELELRFDEIAFKEKPQLGPTFLHMYDAQHPSQYIGRLLLEIRSETLSVNLSRELVVRNTAPVDEQRWWQLESYLVEFIALQGEFVHSGLSNMKISLKFAEHLSNYVECYLKNYNSSFKPAKGLKYFRQESPYKAIYLQAQLPDNRLKYDSDAFIQEILDYMKTEIETFKMFQLKYHTQYYLQAKCFKAVIMNILAKIKEGVEQRKLQYSSFKDPTAWDTNRYIYLQDFFNKMPDELRSMRHRLKSSSGPSLERIMEEVLQDLIKLTQDLAGLLTTSRIQDEWPDVYLVLSHGSNKEFALCKLNAKYFVQQRTDKETGVTGTSLCWRVRNFVFKSIQCMHSCTNCGCTVAVLQGCLGIVIESERNDFVVGVSQDWKLTENFYWHLTISDTMFKCRLFIHQAKVRPGSDSNGLCDAHVRVVFGGQCAETPTEEHTLSPIWNVVICFEGVMLPGGIHWYKLHPPLIAVELFDTDRLTSDDYLGCGILMASVLSADAADEQNIDQDGSNPIVWKTRTAMTKFEQMKVQTPPPLKWIPMSMNGGVRAEVLMSAEMVEMQPDVNMVLMEPTITDGIPSSIRPTMRNFVLEVVFAGFRNYYKTGRHRVKVMMGDLLLSSGLSSSRMKQSVNFLVLYSSGVVNLPEQLEYWPAIIATDVQVSGKGVETTVGAVLIANSKRYLTRDQSAKPLPLPVADIESSYGSTTLHFHDDDDNEERPLLPKPNSGIRAFFKGIAGAIGAVFSFSSYQTGNADLPLFEPGAGIDTNEFSWWSKFYCSMLQDPNDDSQNFKHHLIVYARELEKQLEFSYLQDWAEPFKLVHGVKYKKNALPKEETYATVKLNLKIRPCQCGSGESGAGGGGDADGIMLKPLATALNPRYQSHLQVLGELCKIVVRVYIVQALNLYSHDWYTQSDAYVKIQLGQMVISNRANHVANQSNPIFGKCFQLEGVLPRETILEVGLFDRNTMRDEIIGSTFIDLEDRWRSKHRATVGIANEYSRTGYNKWRDISSPSEILQELCRKQDINMPILNGETIEVDGVMFSDETRIATDEDLQERLSLTVLKNLEKLPSFGYKLVPEHVETRPLYRKDCPGIEQGKVQLWIEMYEGNLNIPSPIDITPHPPQPYELRCIIYNCSDVVLDEKNIFGKRMSDIYVRGWCNESNKVQNTDTHYRSLNGEGAFNWRMVFPIKYSAIEDMMVVKRKAGLSDEYETKQPPILTLQIWDNDIISRDDFLGVIEINLSNFSEPFENAKSCELPEETCKKYKIPFTNRGRIRKSINLFRQKHIKGWFPMRGPIEQKKTDSNSDLMATALTGKIEVELEIFSEVEASANPVGLGREPPHALPEPVRPETSFNPFLSPLKGLRYILIPACKKYLLYTVLIILVSISIIVFLSKIPTMFLP